jgi:hypothetical protein
MRYVAFFTPSPTTITVPRFEHLVQSFQELRILSTHGEVRLIECPENKIEMVREAVHPYYLIIDDFEPPVLS